MIGLALITFVAILGAGLHTSFGDAVDKLFVADYALTCGVKKLGSPWQLGTVVDRLHRCRGC